MTTRELLSLAMDVLTGRWRANAVVSEVEVDELILRFPKRKRGAHAVVDGELINLLCAHLPLSPEDKQALIETVATAERAALMRGLLDMASVSSMHVAEHRH